MKKSIIYGLFIVSAICLGSCNNDDDSVSVPAIEIPDEKKEITNANEGDLISIPFTIEAQEGIRKIAYYFIVNTANETKNEDPQTVENFDKDYPTTYNGSIDFPVRTEMNTLILVAFNVANQASEIHIPFSGLKQLPVFAFDKGVDFKEKAFLGKKLRIKGGFVSQYDVSSFRYRVVNNGTAGSSVQIPVTDKKNMTFDVTVLVEAGLENVIFTVENIHGGTVEKTFRVLNVLTDDDISIEMAGGITELADFFEDEEYVIEGSVESGSDIVGLSYAVKKNGEFGEPVAVKVPEGTADVLNFSIELMGEAGTEAIKVMAVNESEMVEELILDVPRVETRIVHMKDVVLTTEIGEGKHNWFSCYLEPHVFDQKTAAQHAEMMDFVAAKYTTGVPYLLSAMVYTAGGNYAASISPYMVDFNKMTYLLMTANRADAKNAFDGIGKTSDMEALFSSVAYYATAGRLTSGALTAGNHHVIAWGNGLQQNKAMAIIRLKEIVTSDGVSTVKFDIKFGKPDYRTQYNPASIMTYNPQ